MAKNLDSRSLFLLQMKNHCDVLSGVLGVGEGEGIGEDVLERCVVSTNMLASSANLMELAEWAAFLGSFESLLQIYRDKNLPLDDRIAQITSELIEREEEMIGSGQGKNRIALRDAVPPEEIQALAKELVAIMEAAEEALPVVPEPHEDKPVLGRRRTGGAGDRRVESACVETAPKNLDVDKPFGRLVGEVWSHTHAMLEAWESVDWEEKGIPGAGLEDIRKELYLIDFYAQSMEQIIQKKKGAVARQIVSSPHPIRIAVEDFASILCAGSNRRLDVSFLGEETTMDTRLFASVFSVLKCMIHDVFLRCDDTYLRIELDVEEKDGAVIWTIRDNGNNFLTDSRLDPEDSLAFYPGLKQALKVLTEMHSLLWVEPDESHDTRFAFTVPALLDSRRFMIWGSGRSSFAVLSTQLSDIFSAGEVEVESDAGGGYLIRNGRRVPVLRLSQFFNEAPSDGDRIAVIGCLEDRIAFYIKGEARLETGVWVRDSIPVWKGMEGGVVRMGDQKIQLVEAGNLIRKYLNVIDTVADGSTTGSSIDHGVELPRGQAPVERTSGVLPAASPVSFEEAEVLIVERSESLRNTFASILSRRKLKPQMCGELEDAMRFINRKTPRLIISEFRMPSMAAKVLVDKLKREGKKVPVLVTTSHRGENADLLVTKLGASGYLSKPLNPDEVLSRIGDYLQDETPAAKQG